MKSKYILPILFLLIASCTKKTDKVVDDPHQGTITIEADESFKSVMEALTDAYMAVNPQTTINLVTKKEDLGFLDLLNGKARVVVMSRELTEQERAAYDAKVDLKWQPAKFAGDAVVFVVPKNSTRNALTYQEIQESLNSDRKDLIFDGNNSSNINFVAQKLNKNPADLKYSIIAGNENLIKQLTDYPDKIGVVSLNTISRPYGAEAEKLRDMVKVLPVTSDGKTYEPSLENIKNMQYPFTRVLYLLTNEGYYGLGNGFIRYACTQVGQIVVEKEGLQPYNTYKREVQMR